ncbi:MAG: dihydroorotate dehydrogenase [Phycisphaerales bacterium]|nr:dihydroorotate dehydrogenase [Phycisphaerales bacterium]
MPAMLGKLKLQRPLVAAAGTAGTGWELGEVLALHHLGAVTTKSITREARSGNAPMRVAELPTGMLNAVGLANPGIAGFLSDHRPRLEHLDCPVIGSVAGASIDDYVFVAEALASSGLAAIECNVSCPNTGDGRLFSEDAPALKSLVQAVRSATGKIPLLVKLPLDFQPRSEAAIAAIEGGADVLTLTNTVPGMAIDPATRRPRLGKGAGGVSGPGIHPMVVRMVRDVHANIAADASVPIIGLGGVMNWGDAAELILAGASAVGVGTALFADPRRVVKINKGLDRWVRDQGVESVSDLVGALAS